MNFATKIRHLTDNRHRSAVAALAGMPPTAISNYVNRGQLPRLDNALQLAKALKVSLDWLADDELGLPAMPRPAIPRPGDEAATPDEAAELDRVLSAAMHLTGERIRRLRIAAEALQRDEPLRTGTAGTLNQHTAGGSGLPPAAAA